ncbi:restriction endonuclease subunit S [Winogradskyella schleiferi]|uniref:restriction endonuclease subunit S n=1 Tax=Winogradskyella schleiferi TaxID=2686078 RepID=UPI0015B79CDC|nr:restriction endonuclease subunit S [Winogradskyella schleiferi]
MKSNYKLLGDYITRVDVRNKNLETTNLKGLSMTKEFRDSTSNIVGVDLSKYKLVPKNHFACDFMSVIRVHKLPVVHQNSDELIIVSPAYTVFKVIDESILDSEYLMMWFRRPEFDRYADFRCDSAIRGGFKWDEIGEVELPIPSIEKQRDIVKEYNTIVNRIKLNETLNQKLEDTAQALYKHWFVDFEFPNADGKPYKSSGGEMVYNEELDLEIPLGWKSGVFLDHIEIQMGQSPKGDTYNLEGIGTPLVNGPVEFGDYFTIKSKWTTSPTKLSKKGDLIVCVRGSTVGRYVKSNGEYCLGRGVCSLRGKVSQIFVDLMYKRNLNDIISLATGSTFPNIDRQTISTFPAIVPPKEIILVFENKFFEFQKMLQSNSNEKNLLIKTKDLLLSKMSKVETKTVVV